MPSMLEKIVSVRGKVMNESTIDGVNYLLVEFDPDLPEGFCGRSLAWVAESFISKCEK
jgi:hypothetical protein